MQVQSVQRYLLCASNIWEKLMNNLNLPEVFETFSEQRKNSFIKVREYRDKGTPIVGAYCTYFPKELVTAIGGVAVSLCATSDETIGAAEEELPKNLCPLIKSSYGFAKTDKCPCFYFSDLVVGETTCDGKKKMYEYMRRFKDVHVMQLPQNQEEESFKLWVSEIKKMANRLEDKYRVKITEDRLISAIKLENAVREELMGISELMKEDNPALTGTELFNILRGSEYRFDKEELVTELKRIKENLIEQSRVITNGIKSSSRPMRILLTGCPIGGVFDKVVPVIESNGGLVVAYENCNGMKNVANPVLLEGDLYENIARRYLDIGCSVMSPNKNRMDSIDSLIEEYKVDGIMEILLPMCHTYSVESGLIKTVAKKHKIPFISITTDYSSADSEQVKLRISAFTEMFNG